MRKRSSLAVVAALLTMTGITALASPAAALTNHTVTTTDDVVATDGQTSLREAMIAADNDGDHSTITLSPGLTYNLDLCEIKAPGENNFGQLAAPPDDDNNNDGDLDHNAPHNLTIIGNGATIDQTCFYDRVIHSMNEETHLVIDNTIIRDGNQAPEYGDNIRSLGNLTLQNGTVVTDGWDYDNNGGYAVVVGTEDYDPTRVLTINNASIGGNGESGARLNYGTMVVNGATVANNAGSGLVANFAQVTMTNSTVTGNPGTGVAGIDSGTTMTGSTVSGNGQGVSASGNEPGASPIEVINSSVDDNTLGGIACSFCLSVTVTGSSVSNNGSLDGHLGSFGGISMFTYTANDGINITGSSLTGNRSPREGGAIRADFVDDFNPDGTIPSIVIDESDISNNRSGIQKDGGGLWANDATVTVTGGSTFNNNWAKPTNDLWGGDGGAIWLADSPALTIEYGSFDGNRAQGAGGAIHTTETAVISIDSIELINNAADDSSGGALFALDPAEIEIDDSTFVDNRAKVSGGGAYIKTRDRREATVHIDGSTFGRNYADRGNGGGVAIDGDEIASVMVNTTVADNTVGGTGGGVSVFGDGTLDLWHVTMAANESPRSKVANLFHQGGDVTTFGSFIGIGVGGDDCGTSGTGLLLSLGYNRSGDASCPLSHWSDDTGVVGVGLGPLADNGGPTPTRKPSKMSPLVNVIPVVNCIYSEDQRNIGRPLGANCDVGAVEVDGPGGGPGDIKPNPERPKPPGSVTTPTAPPPDPGSGRRLAGL